MLKKVILIFLGCMCLSALYADTHKQRMIDLINSKEYEQAARELPLVEDWIFDLEDERMYMNVSAGVDLLQYVDTLDIYTSEKDSLFKFLGCVCRGYGKYFMKQEEYKTAIPFMELSESIFAIVPGKTHPYYASILDELLIVYKNTGDHSKEASVFLKSLNVRKNDLLKTPPDYTTFLDGLGIVWYDTNSHDYSQAENFYLEVLNIMKPMLRDSTQNYANLLFDVGKLYKSAAETAILALDFSVGWHLYERALCYYIEALNITQSFSQENNQHILANILLSIGDIYEDIGDYVNAEIYYDKALSVIPKITQGDMSDYGESLVLLASFFNRKGDYIKADSCFQEGMKILKMNKTDDAEYLDRIGKISLSFTEQKIADIEYAILVGLEILKHTKSLYGENSREYLDELEAIGYYYECVGNYAKADSCYQIILNTAKENLKDSRSASSAFVNTPWGDEIPPQDLGNYVSAVLDIGGLYSDKAGECHKAESYYLECLEQIAIYEDHESIKLFKEGLLTKLGKIYNQMGDYEKSEKCYLEVQELQSHKSIFFTCDLGDVYMNMCQYSKADSCYQEALKSAEDSKNEYYDASYEFEYIGRHMSALYIRMGNLSKAESYVMKSMLDHKNGFLFQVDINEGEQLWEFWHWTKTNIYFEKEYPRFAYLYHYEKPSIAGFAYDNELFTKGLFLNTSNLIKYSIADSKDTFLISKWNELTDRRQRIHYLQQNDPQNPIIRWLSEESKTLERLITGYSSTYRQNQELWQITWDSVRMHLQKGQVAIEYMVAPLNEDSTMYCALLLRQNSQYPEMIPLFEEKEVQSILKSSTENQLYDYNVAGQQLSSLVWSKVQPYMKKGETIYFAPSGLLHQLAIEALPYDRTHTMSDVYNMVRLSSTREIVLNKTANTHTTATLYGGIQYNVDVEELLAESEAYSAKNLLASRGIEADTLNRGSVNYLAGTKTEVENINRMLRTNHLQVQLFTATNANEESFKSLSGTHQNILHIATHGFFWSDSTAQKKDFFAERMTRLGDDKPTGPIIDPLNRCGLLFAGANLALQGHSKELPEGVQDGILTAKEISLLDLRDADLVVLSACETGKGEISGDGVFGLQRAFKMAGVQTIIMSLWPVNDAATQMLMTEFYRNWITSHQSKREAFRNAQNAVRAQYKEPVYWAGFIMLD